MKNLLLILLLALPLSADHPIPPHAVAKFCGNVVIQSKYKRAATLRIQREGCAEVRFVLLEDDYVLAYGIKILTSE